MAKEPDDMQDQTVVAAMPLTGVCPNCKETIESGASYCGNCGQSLGPMPSASERAVPAYALPDPIARKNETKAFTALVVAILSIPALIVPYLALILAIVAVVLSRQARPTLRSKGVSTAAFVVAGITIALVVLIIVYSVLFFDPNAAP